MILMMKVLSFLFQKRIIAEFLIEHSKNFLIINGKQSVKLKSDSISFKNYFKQLSVPFKIYADFECLLKEIKSNDKNNSSYTKTYSVLLIKLFVLITNLAKEFSLQRKK